MNKGKEKVFLWGAGKNAKDILSRIYPSNLYKLGYILQPVF